jgi:hypothetical protein
VKKKDTSDVQQYQSMMGKIIDLPLDEFKAELIKQKVNIGTMNNLILNLESIYYDLRKRKDAVLDLVFKGLRNREDPDIQKSLDGIYAEMTKIEQKVVYLKELVGKLVDVDKTPS